MSSEEDVLPALGVFWDNVTLELERANEGSGGSNLHATFTSFICIREREGETFSPPYLTFCLPFPASPPEFHGRSDVSSNCKQRKKKMMMSMMKTFNDRGREELSSFALGPLCNVVAQMHRERTFDQKKKMPCSICCGTLRRNRHALSNHIWDVSNARNLALTLKASLQSRTRRREDLQVPSAFARRASKYLSFLT